MSARRAALLAAAGHAPGDSTFDITTIDSNGGWTWFNSPEAICYEGAHRKLYIGFVHGRSPYHIMVTSLDLDTGARATTSFYDDAAPDDHRNCAICVLGDGRIMVAAVGYLGVQYRISTSPEDISALGAMQIVPGTPGFGSRYANVYRLSSTGNTYVFYRGTDYQPKVVVSPDDGTTWSTPASMFTAGVRPYLRYASDGVSRIHFFATHDHPREATDGTNDLYHWYIDTATGNAHRSDGTAIKSIAAILGGSPLTVADVTRVYDANVEGAGLYDNGNAWVWSIQLDPAGLPVVSFMNYPTADAQRHLYGRWTGTAWEKHTVTADAGGSLYGLAPQAEPQYSPGVHVDSSDTTVVWACILDNATGISELWRCRTTDGGATWTRTQITFGSSAKNYRPITPRNRLAGAPAVLWNYGTYVAIDNWNAVMLAATAR